MKGVMGRKLVPNPGPAVEIAPHVEKQREGVCQTVQELNSPKLIVQINVEKK
jgi:hypothetical protein